MSEPNKKYCIYCWLSAEIKEKKEQLEKNQKEYQGNKEKYPGYENSHDGIRLKDDIESLKKSIPGKEKQLKKDFTCLKNDTCGKKCRDEGGCGIGKSVCTECGKYLMLSFPDPENTNYKAQDIHNHNCQGKDKQPTERERETILSYFKKNNIKSIKLENNKLIIKYNHKEEEEPNTTELQQIQEYIQNHSQNNQLTLQDLQQTNTEKPFNWTPWIVGGSIATVLLVIGIIAYRSNKRKNIKKYEN